MSRVYKAMAVMGDVLRLWWHLTLIPLAILSHTSERPEPECPHQDIGIAVLLFCSLAAYVVVVTMWIALTIS